jgi:hypothetical protein
VQISKGNLLLKRQALRTSLGVQLTATDFVCVCVFHSIQYNTMSVFLKYATPDNLIIVTSVLLFTACWLRDALTG